MTTTALCQFVRVLNGSTVQYAAQNYYIGQTVDGYPFAPFTVGPAVAASSADENESELLFPYSRADWDFFYGAFTAGWIADILYRQFTPIEGAVPPMTLIARYTGEIVEVGFTVTGISVKLGSALSPIAAQIPPRKFSTTLTGDPPYN